jgi:regulator of protease activity HflC (stomatin/prohibitin superfamily)
VKKILPFALIISSLTFSGCVDTTSTVDQVDRQQQEQQLQQAQGRINQARGEAEAQKLLQVSIDDKILRKQELDNQSLAIAKWDGHLPNVNSGAVPFLNVTEAIKS